MMTWRTSLLLFLYVVFALVPFGECKIKAGGKREATVGADGDIKQVIEPGHPNFVPESAEEEADHYDLVLEKNPNDLEARARLASALFTLGSHDDAFEHIQYAAYFDPKYDRLLCDMYTGLGQYFFKSSKIDDAIGIMGEVATRCHMDPTSHFNLAVALLQKEGDDKAAAAGMEALFRAIRIDPTHEHTSTRLHMMLNETAVVYHAQGEEHRRTGQLAAAVDAFTATVALEPSVPAYQYDLGMALVAMGDAGSDDAAIGAFRKAVFLDPTGPDAADAHAQAAKCLLRRNQPAEAALAFQDALKAGGSGDISAVYGVGHSAQLLGKHQEANRRFEEVAGSRSKPHADKVVLAMLALGRAEEALGWLQELGTAAPVSAVVAWAGGAVDAGLVDEGVVLLRAFAERLLSYKADVPSGGGGDPDKRLLHSLSPSYSMEVYFRLATLLDAQARAMPATATAAAAADEDATGGDGGGESEGEGGVEAVTRAQLFTEAFRYARAANALAVELMKGSVEPELAQLRYATEHTTMDVLERNRAEEGPDRVRVGMQPTPAMESITPVFIVGLPRSGTTLVEQMLSAHPGVVAGGEDPVLAEMLPREFGRRAVEAMAARALHSMEGMVQLARQADGGGSVLESPYVTNKYPHNFLHAPLLSVVLPRARIVHVSRGAKDNALSAFFGKFAVSAGWKTDLGGFGRYQRLYSRMMDKWRGELNVDMFELSYEALVSRPEETARALLEYLDLPWDDAVLSPQLNPRVPFTLSAAAVKKPMNEDSVGRWEAYAHEPELKLLEAGLSGELEEKKQEGKKKGKKKGKKSKRESSSAAAE